MTHPIIAALGCMPPHETQWPGHKGDVLLNALVVLNSDIATQEERDEVTAYLNEHVEALRKVTR